MAELSTAQGPALSTLAFLLLGASSHTWVPSAGNSPAPCSPGSHFLANSHLRRNSPLHLKHLCHPQPRDYSNRVEMSPKAKTSRFKSCTVTWACGLTVHGSRSVCVPHHGLQVSVHVRHSEWCPAQSKMPDAIISSATPNPTSSRCLSHQPVSKSRTSRNKMEGDLHLVI